MIITGKDLKRIGLPQGKAVTLAKTIAQNHLEQGMSKAEILILLQAIVDTPDNFIHRSDYADLAQILLPPTVFPVDKLLETPQPYAIFGADLIPQAAEEQMRVAAHLPIATRGALMPDAHVGYGLPIGGVLATENAVIPYAVGVDIACRMMLSVFPEPPALFDSQFDRLQKALEHETHFGIGNVWKTQDARRPHHAVLDQNVWDEIPMLRALKDKAQAQLGTSGSGNHFVEWGIFSLKEDDLGLKAGRYMALLSHSGSRGVGASIAEHFTKLAKIQHPHLPPSAQNLSWLGLDTEEGQQYWLAMHLAGDFAQANHHIIHRRVADYAGLAPLLQIENHHNFAWKEVHDHQTVIVHRKGATPASEGTLGIIPGSMADEGYLVRGLGNALSLESASHGAGRQMSRKKANESITKSVRDTILREKGITLLGGGLDESPQAYKPIREVMKAQKDLVEIVGKFEPKIVKMA